MKEKAEYQGEVAATFKTSFSKYLLAFTIIILASFMMLSGIITSIISNHLDDEKERNLERSAAHISKQIEDAKWADLSTFVRLPQAKMVVMPILSFNEGFDVIITDVTGEILLSSVGEEDGIRVFGELGTVGISDEFTPFQSGESTELLKYVGDFDKMLSEPSLVIASPVVVEDETRGYILAIAPIAEKSQIVSVTRKAVFNSSIWVMLAAVIATYFITERIIHPLRMMKGAAKSFAKGDFSSRVTVYGNDEVAELAKAFNNMAESLESLEKMRNTFLANVSHDLRTPMTTISGFIDGITSGAIPPDKHNYYLGIISAEVHRLSRLVSQILDVSRLDSGERKFNFTEFDVAEMARLVLISFEQKIEEKMLDVSFEADEDSMMAIGDKDAIYQVIYNLTHNAIKFSREGGRFEIKLKLTQNKKILYSIYDEGQTISDEDIQHVFDKFYKTDKSRGLDKHGVGLGLYICKSIIDSHGEEIGVSAEDGGTAFHFTLKSV